MKSLEKYRGIHPGAVIERELKKQAIAQRPFALSISEFPQTLNAILKGKRDLNIPLALRIEKALGFEEGSLMLLQVFHDIQKEKQKQAVASPDLLLLRENLFWDTDLRKINWQQQADKIIQRVFERGNAAEKQEITRFYGKPKVRAITGSTSADHTLPLIPGKKPHR